MFIHANISPIKAYVCEAVLYNMDTSKIDNYIQCVIIGVSCYPNCSPTFQILIDNQSIFFDIPPHLLFKENPGAKDGKLELKDLVYHNSPSGEFATFKIDLLKDKNINVFIKTKNIWKTGEYQFTIDWYQNNDLLHCILLDNYQFAFLPNHKITINKVTIPNYLKLRYEWRV